MTKRDKKRDERKVRSSDFSMYQTAEYRATGLHHIFDSFHHGNYLSNNAEASLSARSDGASSAYVDSTGEILKALEKLTKKDGTTKLKSLEALESLFEAAPDYIIESVMHDFLHVFKRLAVVEPQRKVRLYLGKVLCKIATTLKKRMQAYMENLVTHWFLAMHDEAPEVASAYLEAFQSLFTTPSTDKQEGERKIFRVLAHYIQKIADTSCFLLSRDIESYKKDWLDVFGKSCDNSATISDIHNRLMCTVLHALTDLMVHQREYGDDKNGTEQSVSVLLTSSFVVKVASLCRSSSYKQRLFSTRLMVEFVKVLRPEHLQLAKDIFKIAMQRIYSDEEASIIYQHIRLMCACTRYNRLCWEGVVLENYTSLLNGIMDRYNGDFSATIELYSLFPCLVSYLPPDWLRSKTGIESVLKVTEHLLELMEERLHRNYESSFAFDAKLFSQLGSSMLYCYYRILLMLEENSERVIERALAPLVKLQSHSSTARYFLAQLPRIFTEFIEESVVFRSPEGSEALIKFLTELNDRNDNVLFMARVFSGINQESHTQGEYADTHVQLRSYAKVAEKQLKEDIANYELPPMLLEYLEEPSSVAVQKKIEEMITVLEGATLQTIAPDSRIFEIKRFVSHKFEDAWKLENVLSTLSLAMTTYKPLLEAPLNYFSAEEDADTLAFLALLALQNCESEEQAYQIGTQIYQLPLILEDGNNLSVIMKFIQASKKYSKVLSGPMISWLRIPSHLNRLTCEAVYDCVDPSALDMATKQIYELLHASVQLGQRGASKSYMVENQLMMEDVVAFYLVGYYLNLPVKQEVLFRFCLDLLPLWATGQSCTDAEVIRFALKLKENVAQSTSNTTDPELYVIKDVIYAMLALQGDTFWTTRSISRTLAALSSSSIPDASGTFSRNAVLFSHLWLINCEKLLQGPMSDTEPTTSSSSCHREDRTTHFIEVLVSTLVTTGFSCQLFEKLTDKLLHLNICADQIAKRMAQHLLSFPWSSKNELEQKNQFLYSYLCKSPTRANVMRTIFKQSYASSPFAGIFIGTINRINNEPVTLLDELVSTLKACGDSDVPCFINCISEIGRLLECSVDVTGGEHTIKNEGDSDYMTIMMVELPLTIFELLNKLGSSDPTITCWLHHALIDLFGSCLNSMKAINMDPEPFINLLGKVWLMRSLIFCYSVEPTTSPVNVELLSSVIKFCFSQELVSFKDLNPPNNAVAFSVEGTKEYVQVLEALYNENLSRVLTAGSVEDSLDTIDPHYMITMIVQILERLNTFFGSDVPTVGNMKQAKDDLKLAAYEFLSFCLKFSLPYSYSVCTISQLWNFSFLLDGIAKFSGALCMGDLDKTRVLLELPQRFVDMVIENSKHPVNTKVNLSQLLFYLLQNPEPTKEQPEDAEKPNAPKAHPSELNISNGRRTIVFYLNLVLGPHLTESLFKIYDSTDMCPLYQENLEHCLTAWLSVFTLFQNLKKTNRLTLYNALNKLLTIKPSDAGGSVYDLLAADLTADLEGAENENCYMDAWWLQTAEYIPEHNDDSVLHVFIQILVLCLDGNSAPEEGSYSDMAKNLYYKVCSMFPEEVNHVWNQCKNSYLKKHIMQFTRTEVTQRLIAEELGILKKFKSKTLQILHDADYKNIYASLDTKAELVVTLTVKIPANFPLEPLSFVSSDEAGTFKNKHIRWLMMAQTTANRSGISQGLLLWTENITNYFDGIEECPICYSIVHLQFNTIPGKTCKVCKHKFHAECLYKWFRNAPKAKCPLCQSLLSFTNSGHNN